MKIESNDWREQWAVIYHYVSLYRVLPENFPLPEKFWGWVKKERKGNKKRLFSRMINLGPYPTKASIQNILGYGSGDTDNWIKRRFGYVKDIK